MMTDSYVSLDLEMTGLSAKTDRIIEIGAVKVRSGEIVDTFSSFVNPHALMDERVRNLTGITQDDLLHAPDLPDILPDFLAFLEDDILVGHRIQTDYAFLKRAVVNAKGTFEKSGIDTLKLSRKMYPNMPAKRLGDMCAHFEIDMKAHRAIEDARATHRLFEALKKAYAEKTYDPENEVSENDFVPKALLYKVKKEAPASQRQKKRLRELCELHHIIMTTEIDFMSKNEISRMTDRILAEHGRLISLKENEARLQH